MSVRRYRCRACKAVMLVVPRGILRRRWYAGPAIAMALFLHLIEAVSAVQVRTRLAPAAVELGHSARRGWAQLARWVRAAPSLFGLERPAPDARAVLAQLEGAPAASSKVQTRLERIVAGAMAIGAART